MKQKVKRMLSVLMVVTMLVTLLPVRGYAAEGNSSGTVETAAEQGMTEETAAEGLPQEPAEETATEEGSSEAAEAAALPETTAVPETAEVAAEVPAGTEEAPAEEAGTEAPAEEQPDFQIAAMSLDDAGEDVPKARAAALDDQAPLGVILSAGSWSSGHYKWYVNTGDLTRHYIFCMEKGKPMQSGIFKPSRYTGACGTAENTFRIAVALDYFHSKGGWGSEDGYVDTQYAVWNQGTTAVSGSILTYSHYLWQLTELNPDRAAGNGSYNTKITAVSASQTAAAASRSKITAKEHRLAADDTQAGGYDINSTIKLSGSAWKYFANPQNWGASGIRAKCYDASGRELDSGTAKASVSSDGNLNVHVRQTDKSGAEIATKKDNAVLVVMQVAKDYAGASSISYLTTSGNNQTLAYDAETSSPAYFAVKVWARPDFKTTGLQINKVDEFGNAVDGAVFRVTGTTAIDSVTSVPIFDPPALLESGSDLELEKAGNYHIEEIQAPPGMEVYTNQFNQHLAATFNVEEKVENGVSKLYVVPEYTYAGVTAAPSDDGLSYTYTVTDTYSDGDAVLHKLGNIFVSYENGQFVYKKRDLENVTFALHAAEDIYAGDLLLFSAGQLITNEVLNASPWNLQAGHHADISTTTGADGKLYYHNLPYGSYYVVETGTPYEGYWVSGSRLDFTINDATTEGGTQAVQINGEGGYENNPVYANCLVIKKEKKEDEEGNLQDTGKPLAGAEFTLYAHLSNTNFDGASLFTADQTQPAVVSRKNGQEQKVANQWIPLETIKSNADGEAYFEMNLPYGRYLVVETYPPENQETGESYALPEESWEFTHKAGDSDAFASGALFTHTFYDEKKSNLILVRKSGEVPAGAETVSTAYGEYQKLRFEERTLKDVVFEITDEAGNIVDTVKTNEAGEAKSKDLKPGIYYVAEKENGGSLKLDTVPKKVELKNNLLQTVQVAETEFMNGSLDTRFSIYKTAETVKRSGQTVDGESSSGNLYTYPVQEVSGVVFGVFTKNDIPDYSGDVAIKAGSCVGYCVTDEQGVAQFKEQLVNGDYYWQEIQTKDETYIQDTGRYDFQVKLNGENLVADLNKAEPLLNKKYKGSIKVIKTDGRTKKPLEGVTFVLYDKDKEELGTFRTDAAGEILVNNLPLGRYYLEETETLKGYKLSEKMEEIDLTQTALDQVIRIENNRNDTRITVKTDSTISGRGHVATGDWITRLMAFLFMLSLAGLSVTAVMQGKIRRQTMMKPKRIKPIKKIFMAVMVVLAAAAMGVPPVPAQAAQYEVIDVTIENAEIMLDGKVSKWVRVNLTQVNKGKEIFGEDPQYRLNLSTDQGDFILNGVYTVTSDGRMFPEGAIGGSFTLTGYGYDDSLTVPNTISVSFDSKVALGPNKYYIEGNSVTGKVKRIAYQGDSSSLYGKKVVIPADSGVEEVVKADRAGAVSPLLTYEYSYDLHRFPEITLDCRKRDVSIPIRIMADTVSEQDYAKLQEILGNITVCYGSRTASSLCQRIRMDNGERRMLEPAYCKGALTFDLDRGTDTNPAEYVIGKKMVLTNPVRKDHRFCGWYTDPEFKASSLLSAEPDGSYYLTEEQTAAEAIHLYARWVYEVMVTRDGINYRIAADKTAAVMPGTYQGSVKIADHVSYNGISYPVAGIADGAFAGQEITSVTLPETIYQIGADAFAGCARLTDVYVDSMSLTLGNVFDKAVNLHAYASSKAYERYEAEGYTGQKTAYGSTITYVLNGGTNHPENPSRYEWKSLLRLQPAEKEGCRFDGWYTDSGFQPMAKVESIYADTYADVVLYAKFTEINSGAAGGEADSSTSGQQEQGGKPGEKKTSSVARASVASVKITNVKGRKIKVVIKGKNASGYQLRYSTSKKFKKKQTKTTAKSTFTISRLKKGKTYYVKVRAYNKVNGKKVYSPWSKVKKVKIKK